VLVEGHFMRMSFDPLLPVWRLWLQSSAGSREGEWVMEALGGGELSGSVRVFDLYFSLFC
jgi:hypothetical protein